MVDDVRLPGGEDLVYALGVLHGTLERVNGGSLGFFASLQFLVDPVQGEFIQLQEQQGSWLPAQDLAAQLAAYGTTGSRD